MRPLAAATLNPTEVKDHFICEVSDGRRFVVSKALFAEQSQLIRELIEEAEDGSVIEVAIPDADTRVLRCVHDYLEHHQADAAPKEIPRPLRGELRANVEPWDFRFVEESLLQRSDGSNNDVLFGVLKASSHLGIPPLRDLCCAALADIVRGASEAQVLAMFGAPAFTPEKEAELLNDFPWLRSGSE